MAAFAPVVPRDRVDRYNLAEMIRRVIIMSPATGADAVTGPFADLLYQVRDRILEDLNQMTVIRTDDQIQIKESARRFSLTWTGDLQKLAESIYRGMT